MKCITIHNVRKRLKGRSSMNESTNNVSLEKNIEVALESNNAKEIMRSIELAMRANPIQLESVLTLFDALYECESSTTGQLLKMKTYICEEAIPKVRDAKEMNTYLRRRLGMARSKVTTRINNKFKKSMSAVQASIGAINSGVSSIGNTVNKGLESKPRSKNESYIECYEDMINMSSIYEVCDRILENYNNISKRFNLEKLFIENTRVNGPEDTVFELCKFIETYNMPDNVKFNAVIETAWYGFENHSIEYNKKNLIEAATEYFTTNKPDGLKMCQSIFLSTALFGPEDIPTWARPITEEDPEENKYQTVFKLAADVQDRIQENSIEMPVSEATDFDKIFDEFKKNGGVPNESKMKALIRKLYSKSVSNIIEETPQLLSYIRYVFVLGITAINVPLGLISFIADLFIRLKYEREETSRMIKCFDSEIKKSEKKLKSTNDEEEKKRLKEYIKSLEKAREKIEEYYDNMLTDKELDSKYSGEEGEKDSFSDLKADLTSGSGNDDDFDDFFFDDDDFNEAAVETIDNLANIVDTVTTYENLEMDTLNNLAVFNGDDIDALAKLSVTYPDVWSPELMEHAFSSQIYKIRKNRVTFESAFERFQMVNCYENAIQTLHKYQPKSIESIGECVEYTECLLAAMESVNSIIETHRNKSIMVEASFTNSLKLAGDRLKQTIVKLSDKDKAMCKTVDTTVDFIKKEIDNALTNENREAVVKGRVLPQASKIIKLAITTGAVWMVQPALAIIGCLGYLGLSAKHKSKERRLILDEYEVELKMCEKYIDIAESKGNMKALKRLLTIQKNLQRQEQRLRYKMKVDFRDDVPDTASRSGR